MGQKRKKGEERKIKIAREQIFFLKWNQMTALRFQTGEISEVPDLLSGEVVEEANEMIDNSYHHRSKSSYSSTHFAVISILDICANGGSKPLSTLVTSI